MRRGICQAFQAVLHHSSPVKSQSTTKVRFSLLIMAFVLEVCLGGLFWRSTSKFYLMVKSKCILLWLWLLFQVPWSHHNVTLVCNIRLLHTSVTSVCYIRMLHLYVTSVYYIRMLHLYVTSICYICILHPYLTSVCFVWTV